MFSIGIIEILSSNVSIVAMRYDSITPQSRISFISPGLSAVHGSVEQEVCPARVKFKVCKFLLGKSNSTLIIRVLFLICCWRTRRRRPGVIQCNCVFRRSVQQCLVGATKSCTGDTLLAQSFREVIGSQLIILSPLNKSIVLLLNLSLFFNAET
jgi:hypothetical protein